MGLYNMQTVNGTIATVELSDDEADKQGYGPEKRVDAEATEKAAAKPTSRARGKATGKPRSRAAARTAKPAPAVEVPAEQIEAANDTTIAAVEVSAEETQDTARS